jgi:excisionase family DNA binding protein
VNNGQEVLTIKQVAEFLQVSTDIVYRLAASGELQGRKIGRIWRFPKEAIRGYLWERESHEARAEADDAR